MVLQHAAEYFSTLQLTGCLLLLVGFRCSPVGVLELGPAFHIIAHSSVPCELRSRESGQNLPTGPLINRGAKRRISRLSQFNKEAVIQLSGVFTVETCGPSISALCEKHCSEGFAQEWNFLCLSAAMNMAVGFFNFLLDLKERNQHCSSALIVSERRRAGVGGRLGCLLEGGGGSDRL